MASSPMVRTYTEKVTHMNIYYLAGKLHTEQTIKQARAYHDTLTEERVIINGVSRDAIGIVMKYRGEDDAFLSGPKGQRAQVSVTLPPRIYKKLAHARSAIAATGVYDQAAFDIQYVHTVEGGS